MSFDVQREVVAGLHLNRDQQFLPAGTNRVTNGASAGERKAHAPYVAEVNVI